MVPTFHHQWVVFLLETRKRGAFVEPRPPPPPVATLFLCYICEQPNDVHGVGLEWAAPSTAFLASAGRFSKLVSRRIHANYPNSLFVAWLFASMFLVVQPRVLVALNAGLELTTLRLWVV